MILLAVFTFILASVAIGFALWSIVVPRAKEMARVKQIQAYGFTASQSISPNQSIDESRRLIPTIANYLGDRMARWFGASSEEKLRIELRCAGYYSVSPRVFNGYRTLAAIAFGLLTLWAQLRPSMLESVALALAFAAIGWIAPMIVVRRRARERLATIDRELPDLIDLLVVTVEAGLSFAASLQVAASRLKGPLGDELRLTLQEQQMGLSTNEALNNMIKRAPSPAAQSFVRSVIQGESLGVSIGTIMRNLADEMRVRRRQSAEERAQKAPTKMLFPLIFMIFPAMGIVLLGPALFEIGKALG